MPKTKNYHNGFLEGKNEIRRQIINTLIEDYSNLEELK